MLCCLLLLVTRISVKGFRSLPPTSSCLDAPPEPRVPVSPFTLLIFVSGGYWLTPTLSCRFWQSGYSPADYILVLRTFWLQVGFPFPPYKALLLATYVKDPAL